MAAEELKQSITDSLQIIVDDFNNKFVKWSMQTGSQANFSWRYGDNGKCMHVDKIMMPVYEDTESKSSQVEKAQEILSKANTTKVSKS